MKLLFLSTLLSIINTLNWSGNFKEAQTEAKISHKHILVSFAGSDWCAPCIRFRKEILESDAFQNYATEHLVLVRADFPRQKKNQLSPEQTKLNEALAERYNPNGKFPLTLLLEENGKVIKSWEGFPNNTPDSFVKEIELLDVKK